MDDNEASFYRDKSLAFRAAETARKFSRFEAENPEWAAEQLWECELDRRVKGEWKAIYDSFSQDFRPARYHNYRGAYRMGQVDTFRHSWSQETNLHETFYAMDVVSQFASICLTEPMPVGIPEVLFEPEIDVKCFGQDGRNLFYKGELVQGSLLAKLVAPRSLKIPYLQCRIGDKVLTGLCHYCLKNNIKGDCRHNDNKAAFVESYTTQDVAYAMHLGYQLKAVYECHLYKASSFFLKPFVQILGAEKVAASGFPESCRSEEAKKAFCQKICQSLFLPLDFLTTGDVSPCLGAKNLLKKMLNVSLFLGPVYTCHKTFYLQCTFGRYGIKRPKDEVVGCRSRKEVAKYFRENEILDFWWQGKGFDSTLYIRIPKRTRTNNLKANISIASTITAHARRRIHSEMMRIEKVGGRIFSCDVDAIYYVLPDSVPQILHVGKSLGDFDHVFPGLVVSYTALSPRNVNVVYSVQKGGTYERIEQTKANGFCLSGLLDIFNHANYQKFLQSAFRGDRDFLEAEEIGYRVKQAERRYNKKSGMPEKQIRSKLFSPKINEKRKLRGTCPEFCSVPFGYNGPRHCHICK